MAQTSSPTRRAVLGSFLLLLWCVALRLPTALESVADWDESIYLLMADQWTNGHLPYTVVWDHKPIGTYVLFRIGLLVLGHSVLSIRVLSMLFVFAGALLLYEIARLTLRSRDAGLAAAITYPAFSLACGGTAANTELFFIALDLGGALLLLRTQLLNLEGRARWLHAGAAGLLFGAALQIKYLALVEQVFFVGLFLAAERRRAPGAGWRGPAALASVLALTMIAPTLAACRYFWIHGEWSSFVEANFLANMRHVRASHPLTSVYRFLSSTSVWLSCTAPLWVAWTLARLSQAPPRSRRAPEGWTERLLLAWALVGLAESGATRTFYLHYYLVTMPPLCLLLACAVVRFSLDRKPIAVLLASCLVVGLAPLATVCREEYIPWIAEHLKQGRDRPAEAAAYLEHRLSPGDSIYVVNDQPIIYFLSGARLPTRYVFPPFLMAPHFSDVSNVDYRAEIGKIVGQRPRCVLIQQDDNPRVQEVRAMIVGEYARERVFGSLEVFCRI